MNLPNWWEDGVRVVLPDDRRGTVVMSTVGWVIRLDGDNALTVLTDPADYRLEVRQGVNENQYQRIVYDAERAVVRSFGCSYVPEWEMLPDTQRMAGVGRPQTKNRAELDGLRALVRGAVKEALAKYVVG